MNFDFFERGKVKLEGGCLYKKIALKTKIKIQTVTLFYSLRIIKQNKMANRNPKIPDNIIRQGKDRADLRKVKKEADKDAFINLYDRYFDDIYRFVYFKVNNEEEARDITSHVFLKAWNTIRENKLDKTKSPSALLYTIARNSVIDHYRKSKPVSSIDNENEEFGAPEFRDDSQDIEADTETVFDITLVYSKLENLKEEYKEIIILKYINELTPGEITRITGKSKSNVRVISHRALKALRELIKEDQ